MVGVRCGIKRFCHPQPEKVRNLGSDTENTMDYLISRRDLICGSAALVGTGCLCHQAHEPGPEPQSNCCSTPALEAESATLTDQALVVDLGKAATLAPVGAAARFTQAERSLDVIIVQPDRGTYVALDGRCTHAGRPLSFVRERRVLQCNNFGHSVFDLTGRLLKGPAERTLQAFEVARDGDRLVISLAGGAKA